MAEPTTAPTLYPTPSLLDLKQSLVGKSLQDIDPPAHILDVAVIRKNCRLMLDATRRLGVAFRAHVKTHKTTELAKLQIGESSPSVRLIASTVAEIENLVPWLQSCVREGKEVSVLYGLPLRPSVLPRLAAISRKLGEGVVSVFVDHPSHIEHLNSLDDATWPGTVPVFVSIDVGDHREGVPPHSRQLAGVATALAGSKKAVLSGLYTYAGYTYGGSSQDEALEYMAEQAEGAAEAALSFLTDDDASKVSHGKITLSIGDTPTVTAAQSLLEDTPGAVKYRNMLTKLSKTFAIEFHAGNYPVLDMQQLATRARPLHFESDPHTSLLSSDDIAVRTLVEVASVYLDRSDKPEALVAAGSLALGREPCKSYPGWAVVTPWPSKSGDFYDPEGSKTGWIIGRVSQEHGVLSWEGPRANLRQLEVGDKLMLWPNHACIAGSHFGWYLVVDSDTDDAEIVRDVWLRWRGW